MRLSDFHRLRLAENPPDTAEDSGHDYTDFGGNPMSPPSELPAPGEPIHEEKDGLSLITKRKGKSLVVDPRQHYIVITITDKDWWYGPRKDLGAVGREKALRLFDRS